MKTILLFVICLAAPSVFAQVVSDPFDATLIYVLDNLSEYGGLLIAAAAVSVAFLVAIKYIKKIPRA